MAMATRRQFLKATAASAAAITIGRYTGLAHGYPANAKLRLGVVGVGGRGGDNLNGVAGEEIAALCDVDGSALATAAERFPLAKKFADFRRMIEAGGLDGVVVSTPDHTHAPAAAMALRAGLHVYCEKPLTHSIYECRTLLALTKGSKAATQLGTQIHSNDNYRRVVELVRAGAIGEVTEVHVWVGGGYCGGERPTDKPAPPVGLDWDLWLGPAPQRDYHAAYAPFAWRGWWDYGNGTLGDMACHHMDLPFWALELVGPTKLAVEGPPPHADACPPWLIVKYVMTKRAGGSVPLTWYHGDKRPHHFADKLLPEWGNGTLFVGAKGMLLADYDRNVLLPEKQFEGFARPAATIASSPGHYAEWIGQAKGESIVATCRFEYAAPLTEAVLLGCVAHRAGNLALSWDAAKGTTGNPTADAFLARPYRAGWSL
ncbi:MAG: Gfo/Idh/MocA family oxidoreductase [Planctomycetes bacterium]|nr:Gfo/Idh/MocA family oxidoreductase [Planctomycetota bacterium]